MNKERFIETTLDKLRLSFGRQWVCSSKETIETGLPTIVGCIESYFIAIELNWENEVLSDKKKDNLEIILKARGFAVVVDLTSTSSSKRVAGSLCNVIVEYLKSRKGTNGKIKKGD